MRPKVRQSSERLVSYGLAKVKLLRSQRGQCVETATAAGAILIRDTTDRDGGTLAFTADAWAEFLGTLR